VVWDGESSLEALFEGGVDAPPEICPWGWSPALVHELEVAGVPSELLPSKEFLRRLRTLSSRESTVPLQRALGIDARVCKTMADVEHCVTQWEKVVLKSPWSSSGKGLMMQDNPNWRNWVVRILRLQGSVIVERLMEKKQDFAMEFWLTGAEARYMGLNVFVTDAHGHFLENKEASQEANIALITKMLSLEEREESLVENGFGKSWLGNLVTLLGGDWNTIYCRGDWSDLTKDDDNGALRFDTETAWNDPDEVVTFLQEKYPSLEFYCITEEPGMGYYATNDTAGEYFPQRYTITPYDCGEEYQYEEGEEQEFFKEIENITGYKVTNFEEVEKAVCDYNEKHEDEEIYVKIFRTKPNRYGQQNQ
jgi:hypothetical protein